MKNTTWNDFNERFEIEVLSLHGINEVNGGGVVDKVKKFFKDRKLKVNVKVGVCKP